MFQKQIPAFGKGEVVFFIRMSFGALARYSLISWNYLIGFARGVDGRAGDVV